MTVSLEVESEIRVLHFGDHLPVGTIAAQLGVHHEVVERVLGLQEPRPPAAPRERLVEPYRDFIDETLKRYPRLVSTRLHDMLKARGFTGSQRTLRRYVEGVRPAPAHEAFLRLSLLVGEQAQVDWAHVGEVAVPGGSRALWLFVMVLAWSRARWAEFVLDLTAWSLVRSLTRACGLPVIDSAGRRTSAARPWSLVSGPAPHAIVNESATLGEQCLTIGHLSEPEHFHQAGRRGYSDALARQQFRI